MTRITNRKNALKKSKKKKNDFKIEKKGFKTFKPSYSRKKEHLNNKLYRLRN